MFVQNFNGSFCQTLLCAGRFISTEFNLKKMDKIVIDKMRDTIIVEKTNGNDVLKGSKFYCGCCGNLLGEAKMKITFPFSIEKFRTSLKNKTFNTMLFGLHHKTCGHTMFSFQKGYGFTKLETYIENVPQPCT